MANTQKYVGIDWSSGAWLAVRLAEDGTVSASTYETIQEFWETHGPASETVVVDVPIGLFEKGDRIEDEPLVRECDRLARKVVGPRYRSVFNPPAREVVKKAAENKSYEAVKELNKELTGKGLTRQSYNIARGIAEVDSLFDNCIDEQLVEGHPEVAFAAFGGEMSYSKKTAAGVHERVEALETVEENAIKHARKICALIADEEHTVEFDDVLDALVLAYTAGYSKKDKHTIPNDLETDTQNRPMQIVYRAEEPFKTEGL